VTGEVVFITGSAHGIGAATARRLAAKGYRLALTDIDASALKSLCAELGEAAFGHALDVTDPAQLEAALDAAWRYYGSVDVVIGNAGKLNCGFILDQSAEDVRQHFEINVMGIVNGFKAAFPRLEQQGHGHLITIASLASFVPVAGQVTYCASKHAVRAIHYGFVQENRGSPVALSIIHPGAVDTDMTRQMLGNPAGALAFADKSVTAEDVAATIEKAIRTRKRELMVPASNFPLRFIGVLPGLLERAIARAARRGLKRMSEIRRGEG
jgi:NADP-dependent 3-hydroxy acid dehydrogenase YdfG